MLSYDKKGVYKINVANSADVTLIPLGFTSKLKSLGEAGSCEVYMTLLGDMIVAGDFQITADDRVIKTQGSARFEAMATPLFQYKNFVFMWGGSYGKEHRCAYLLTPYLASINNLSAAVVKNPKFEEAILNKIGSRIDTEEIEKEIEGLEKQHRQLTGAKRRLGQQMDSLDIMDKFYEKKYQDMETRLYRLYDEIEGVENSIEEVKNRLLNIQQQKISEENVYQFLLYFDKLYDKFTDLEKKEFLNSFVEQVDIYEQEQPDGRFLKHIKFRFPVYFGDRETQELCWDNESTVETVCLLSRKDK